MVEEWEGPHGSGSYEKMTRNREKVIVKVEERGCQTGKEIEF